MRLKRQLLATWARAGTLALLGLAPIIASTPIGPTFPLTGVPLAGELAGPVYQEDAQTIDLEEVDLPLIVPNDGAGDTNLTCRANVAIAINVGQGSSSRSATATQRVRIRQNGQEIEQTCETTQEP